MKRNRPSELCQLADSIENEKAHIRKLDRIRNNPIHPPAQREVADASYSRALVRLNALHSKWAEAAKAKPIYISSTCGVSTEAEFRQSQSESL